MHNRVTTISTASALALFLNADLLTVTNARIEQQRGASMIEFALVLALVALIAIPSVRRIGFETGGVFNCVSRDALGGTSADAGMYVEGYGYMRCAGPSDSSGSSEMRAGGISHGGSGFQSLHASAAIGLGGGGPNGEDFV